MSLPRRGSKGSMLPLSNNNNIETPTGNNEHSTNTTHATTATKQSFDDDFIVVSEFSEQEGPIPLFVIPEGGEGTFNLNSFVLKIMAVDFQNKGSGEMVSSIKDTQVVMPEPSENAHCYVHHFTLLDLAARGYVRPMAMSYITHDPEKIMSRFSDLLALFTQTSSLFKVSCNKLFMKDMEIKVADLYYTQSIAQEFEDQKKDPGDQIYPSFESVWDFIKELEQLYSRLKDFLHGKEDSSRMSEGTDWFTKADTEENDTENIRDDIESNGNTENAKENNREKENSQQHNNNNNNGNDNGNNTNENGSSDKTHTSSTRSPIVPFPEGYEPKFINTLHKTVNLDKALRTINELCEETCEQAMESLKAIHHRFSRPSIILMLEDMDTSILFPSSSLLSIGQTVMLNFNMEADKGLLHRTLSNESKETIPRVNTSTPPFLGYHTPSLGSTPSSSYESATILQNTFSILSPIVGEYDIDQKLYSSQEFPSIAKTLESFSLNLDSSEPKTSLHSTQTLLQTPIQTLQTPQTPVQTHNTINNNKTQLTPSNVPPLALSQSLNNPTQNVDSYSSTSSISAATGQTPSYDKSYMGYGLESFAYTLWGQGAKQHMQNTSSLTPSPSLQTATATTTTTTTIPLTPKSSPNTTNNNNNSNNNNPHDSRGKGLLDLRARYSWVKHLLFSLLKGRPVVVWAHPSNEASAKSLVNMLSMFVPGGHLRYKGSSNPMVCLWRTKVLKMVDLSQLKLIGLSKTAQVAKAVERYVTILDFDTEVLRGPAYSSSGKLFLDDLVSNKKQWPDEGTFLAHVHYVLFDISVKSCMYYHLCCVGIPTLSLSTQSPPVTPTLSALPPAEPTYQTPFAGSSPEGDFQSNSSVNLSRSPSPGQSPVSNSPPLKNSGGIDNSSNLKRHSSLQYGKNIRSSSRSLSDSSITTPPLPPKEERDKSRVSLYRQMEIQPGDSDIIEYLAEVVKEQQALELQKAEGAFPVIRLDYTPTQTFKNTFKKSN